MRKLMHPVIGTKYRIESQDIAMGWHCRATINEMLRDTKVMMDWSDIDMYKSEFYECGSTVVVDKDRGLVFRINNLEPPESGEENVT